MNKISFLLLLGIQSFMSLAQQHLNLDFEILSIEGTSRPWNWEKERHNSAEIKLDTLYQKSGNYSLKIESFSKIQPTSISTSLEPYELLGKEITIEIWTKGKLTLGTAIIAIYSVDNETYNEIGRLTITPSNKWTLHSVEFNVPIKTSSLEIEIRQSGNGIIWYDNIVLKLMGISKNELQIAPQFKPYELKWLKENSYTIQRIDALPADDESVGDDLDQFIEISKNAKIIALGESTHGTSEFFRLKHRMLEFCVKHLGVRLFAIEDNQLVVARVNNYVLGGDGTARSSMYGMLGVWQTEEVHDMIQWIRDYNDLNPKDKVEFTGFDIQNVDLALDSTYAFAQIKSNKLYNKITNLLEDLKLRYNNYYLMSDSVKNGWVENARQVLDYFLEEKSGWLRQSQNYEDSILVYKGIQYANLVLQYTENVMLGHESLYRDKAMAENIEWLIDTYKPGAKVLVWAHDVHISKGEHPKKELNIYYGKSMGAYLSNLYGSKYKAFGLFTYKGKYTCYVSYTDFTVTDCPLYTAPIGSLDEALHRIANFSNSDVLLLNISKAKDLNWITRPIPVRFANHVNIEYGYWTKYSIPHQFDGIFFIDKTTPSKSYAK